MSSFARTHAVIACLQLGLVSGAWAQYRPPPMSDAERLIEEGEELRVAAAKAASFGEKDAAEAKLKEAIAAYEKALASNPNAVTAATGLAMACATLKDWDRIIKVLTPLQVRAPRDVDLAYHLGVALLKKKRYAEAIGLLDLVGADKRTDLFLARYYLGWLALQRQDGARAAAELTSYLRQRPPEVAGNDYEIHELSGRAQLLLKDAPKARVEFEAAQLGRREAVSVQMGLVAVLELEGNPPAAVRLLEGLLVRFPKAPEPRERLGRVLLVAGNLKRAEALTRELLTLQDGAAAHLLMADVFLAKKEYPAAELELRASLTRQPGQPGALIGLANVLQVQARHDEAIAVLVQATTGEGAAAAELLAALGSVYRRAGKYDQAIETHQNLARLALPGALAQVLLGADHFAAAQWDAAIAAYTTALERDPENHSARHWLAAALGRRARVRAEAGLLDEAVRDLRKALELERTVPIARGLGALLLTQRQFQEARTVLTEAAALSPTSWQERYLLSWAQLGSNDAPAAVAGFEQAAGQVREPDVQSQIWAGWALASLEAGDLDGAIKRLTDTSGKVKTAADNLPLALLRRGLSRLRSGNVAGAQADFDAIGRAPRAPELESLFELLRGLLVVEQRRGDLALTAFKKAMPATDKAPATVATRAFLDAYLEYRRDRPVEAKKKLQAARKGAKADPWPEFARANSRRDGELSYAIGSMAQAEKSFKEALQATDPLNSYTLHNLACVQYRKGGAAQAAAIWKGLTGVVPEATLNLGIAAQVQSKDMRRAASYYGQYFAAHGAYSGLAREWKDRIEAIYGVSGDEAEEQRP